MNTIQYELQKYVVMVSASDEMLSQIDPPEIRVIGDSSFEKITNMLLTWRIFERKLQDYKWPATWWDAFKVRWYPLWLLKRHPAKFKTIELKELIAQTRQSGALNRTLRYFIQEGYEQRES
jgi:hypothetical protein